MDSIDNVINVDFSVRSTDGDIPVEKLTSSFERFIDMFDGAIDYDQLRDHVNMNQDIFAKELAYILSTLETANETKIINLDVVSCLFSATFLAKIQTESN